MEVVDLGSRSAYPLCGAPNRGSTNGSRCCDVDRERVGKGGGDKQEDVIGESPTTPSEHPFRKISVRQCYQKVEARFGKRKKKSINTVPRNSDTGVLSS